LEIKSFIAVMKWTINKTEAQPFITVITEGDFNLNDHLKMIENILSRDFWQAGMDILFDHRNLNFGATDISVFKGASRNHQQNDERIGNGKAAHLMKSLTDFGRGRQYELIADSKVSAKLRIFLDEKEAVDWLIS
jgi:hypothetical protein